MKTQLRFVMFAVTTFVALTSSLAAKEVNVYSYRQAHLIEPITEAFTKETGIKVNILFSKKGLAQRIQQEGKYSPADVVLTSDFSRLNELVDLQLVQAVNSKTLEDNIPQALRSDDDLWYALTKRVRNIYSTKSRLLLKSINYEDLADPKYKGKICTRSGKHPYNVALVASMIVHHGEAKTKTWLQGLKANLARRPQGNDRDQVKAVKEGLCDLALGNSYYFGKMQSNPEQVSWAQAVNINFPNQQNRGSHINVSGMALAKYAPNKVEAIALMEFLSGDTAQLIYADANMEYPVKIGVAASKLVASWGDYKADALSLSDIAKHRSRAIALLDEVKFDL